MDRMKLHHTVALALIGWYLMVPPLIGSSGVATQAPLTQWTALVTSYLSEQECQRAKQMMLPVPGIPIFLDDQHLLAIQESQCIPSDSPSLTQQNKQSGSAVNQQEPSAD